MVGNLRFKIDWANLIVSSKFTVFAFFTLYSRAIFQVQVPRGAYIRRGDLTEGFFCVTRVGGLIFGGAYTWTDLFSNFAVYGKRDQETKQSKQPNAIKQTKSKKQNETKQNNTKINCRP